MYAKMFSDSVVTKQDTPEESPGYVVDNLCWKCKHLNREDPLTCVAFPDGIPLIILMGDYDHTIEFNEGGLSDEGVTFSPITFDKLDKSGSI